MVSSLSLLVTVLTFHASKSQQACTTQTDCTDTPGQQCLTVAPVCDNTPIGHAPILGGRGITSCLAGTYATGFNNLECKTCPVGRYYENPGAGQCTCVPSGKKANADHTYYDDCDRGTFNNQSKADCEAGFVLPHGCENCTDGTVAASAGRTGCDCVLAGYTSSADHTVQVGCGPGSYSDNDCSPKCDLCESGRFSTGSTNSGCQISSKGHYANLPEGANAEADCLPGAYQDEQGTTQCKGCNEGNYSSGTSAEECTLSTEGHHANSRTQATGQVACVEGYYQDEKGTTACKDCPPGNYSSGPSAHVICTPSTKGHHANQAIRATGEVDCLPGYYQDEMGTTACKDCPPGNFSSGLSAQSCTPSTKGHHANLALRATGEVDCIPGYYQDEMGTTACKDCQPGDFSSGPSAQSCTPSTRGHHANLALRATEEVDCLPGYYQDEMGTTACKDCQPGNFSSGASAQLCTPSRKGHHANLALRATEEVACVEGYYQDEKGTTACKDCQPGNYSSGPSAHVICTPSTKGHHANQAIRATGEVDCTPGHYQDETGTTECKDCFPGRYESGYGVSECKCASKGHTVNANKTLEVDCGPGQFAADKCSVACDRCGPGRFSNDTVNEVCTCAGAGHYPNNDATKQVPCSIGFFNPDECQSACTFCLPGRFANSLGSHQCDCASKGHTVSANRTMEVACGKGMYADAECSAGCKQCEAGKFSDDEVNANCTCAAGGHTSSEDRTRQVPCGLGFYAAGTCNFECTFCEPGKFASIQGMHDCICASPGHTVTEARDNESACAAGFYAAGQCNSECTPCDPGRFSNNLVDGNADCDCASAGHTNNSDNTDEIVCEPGTFQDRECQPTCKQCQSGRFQEFTGGHNCTCAAKGHTTNEARTDQVVCGSGRYAANECQGECQLCPAGRFANDTVNAQCEHCSHGHAQHVLGSTACYKCGKGKYADVFALPECKSCSISEYSLGDGPNDECMNCFTFTAFFGMAYPDQCIMIWVVLSCFACLVCIIPALLKSGIFGAICSGICSCCKSSAPEGKAATNNVYYGMPGMGFAGMGFPFGQAADSKQVPPTVVGDSAAAAPNGTQASLFCSECGAKFVGNAKFCAECGAKRNKPAQQERESRRWSLSRKDIARHMGSVRSSFASNKSKVASKGRAMEERKSLKDFQDIDVGMSNELIEKGNRPHLETDRSLDASSVPSGRVLPGPPLATE